MSESSEPPQALLKRLSDVKQKILAELWSMKWVKSSRLLELTNQSNFQRRIRELRGEQGFDIESKVIGGEYYYRLRTRPSGPIERRRKYPTQAQKEAVLKRDGAKCNICGLEPPDGRVEGVLQYDHRIPFDSGGTTTEPNLQLLCIRCNVMKRRACQLCRQDTCEECAYAYPERFPARIVVPEKEDHKNG